MNAFVMTCYCKTLRIPWIAHRTNCSICSLQDADIYIVIICITWMAHRTNSSILNELNLPMSWLCNFVKRQKPKYFGHVTRHNGLEKTIMQGMVAGKRGRGKPRQRWEKDNRYVWYDGSSASRVAEDRHQFCRDIWALTS